MRNEKILLIEDEDQELFYLQNLLSVEGYNVTAVSRGEDGMKKLPDDHLPALLDISRRPSSSDRQLYFLKLRKALYRFPQP